MTAPEPAAPEPAAPDAPNPRTLYLEDFTAGSRLITGEIDVTAEGIMAFARAYDPQPAHLSDVTARTTPFRGLAASGWHTAALTMRLLVDAGLTGVAGAGVTLAWPTPTRPGDRLHAVVTTTAVRPSNTKPDRGIVDLAYDTVNQAGEVRQHSTATIIAWRRGSPAGRVAGAEPPAR